MACVRVRASGMARCLSAAALLASLSLAGCQSRDPSTTGSISFGPQGTSDADLRRTTADLGPRFQANPANAALALDYARALRTLGQTNTALAVLQQAALRNPNHPELLAAYGKVLVDSGRYKEAATVLANAHRPERPDWRILSVQGAVADQLGDFEGAQRYYSAALKIVPGEPSVLANQGLSFALAKRLDEAELILTQASQHPRADERVRQNLALVLGLRGRGSAAEAVLKRDLPPRQAAEAAGGLRSMVRQSNSWAALRDADKAEPAGPTTTASITPTKIDAKRPVAIPQSVAR
jgi:Flp pilus assembly protein TadD